MDGRIGSPLERLLDHARALIGANLGDLADDLGMPVPTSNVKAKGWAGQVVERELGAQDFGHGVDFAELGVELKTVPTDLELSPMESTWICHVDPNAIVRETWETSYARTKLAKVLFVALLAPRRGLPVSDRQVGAVVLWSPSYQQESVLRADFDVFVKDYFRPGRIAELTGHVGQVLQVRPKGRNAADTRRSVGPDGQIEAFGRCGFYLRPGFVGPILQSDSR